MNDKEIIKGLVPWIIEDFEDKVQTALGMCHLNSLEIARLDTKSWVANEFLDALCCYDLAEEGLNKLVLTDFLRSCEPFSEEVMSRLANMCPNISHLDLSHMNCLTEAGRVSMASLLRQIVQHNPPIIILNMESFSLDEDR